MTQTERIGGRFHPGFPLEQCRFQGEKIEISNKREANAGVASSATSRDFHFGSDLDSLHWISCFLVLFKIHF